MKLITEAQEIARRFNDDEAAWYAFAEKRALRRLLGSDTPLLEKTLDWLDWQAAEHEGHEVRAIGFFHP